MTLKQCHNAPGAVLERLRGSAGTTSEQCWNDLGTAARPRCPLPNYVEWRKKTDNYLVVWNIFRIFAPKYTNNG